MKPEANKPPYLIERVSRNNRAEDADQKFDRYVEISINNKSKEGYELHSITYIDSARAILVFKRVVNQADSK